MDCVGSFVGMVANTTRRNPQSIMQTEPENTSPRQRIMDGAEQAFLTFGYDGAGMRTVAQYTGYSQAGMAHHFSSKAELLAAVLDRACTHVMDAFKVGAADDPVTRMYRIWRVMSRKRNSIALRSVIISEASTLNHPALERAKLALSEFREAIASTFPQVSDSHLFADAWEGLMVDWLYNPRSDVPYLLKETFFALFESNDFTPVPGVEEAAPPGWDRAAKRAFGGLDRIGAGQAPEDQRRRQILDAAMQVFGDQGYVGGSLRSVAGAIGVTHPALLRHYRTKDDLLRAVLQRRDVLLTIQGVPSNPREAILDGITQTGWSMEVPGLIRLFTALMTRSYQPTTPFHDFFVNRKSAMIGINTLIFTGLAEVDELRPDLDAKAQGLIWAAIWDGAQIRWGLEAGASVSGALARYMNQILVPPLQAAELHRTGLETPLLEPRSISV